MITLGHIAASKLIFLEQVVEKKAHVQLEFLFLEKFQLIPKWSNVEILVNLIKSDMKISKVRKNLGAYRRSNEFKNYQGQIVSKPYLGKNLAKLQSMTESKHAIL